MRRGAFIALALALLLGGCAEFSKRAQTEADVQKSLHDAIYAALTQAIEKWQPVYSPLKVEFDPSKKATFTVSGVRSITIQAPAPIPTSINSPGFGLQELARWKPSTPAEAGIIKEGITGASMLAGLYVGGEAAIGLANAVGSHAGTQITDSFKTSGNQSGMRYGGSGTSTMSPSNAPSTNTSTTTSTGGE